MKTLIDNRDAQPSHSSRKTPMRRRDMRIRMFKKTTKHIKAPPQTPFGQFHTVEQNFRRFTERSRTGSNDRNRSK